ncbi:hypothetical protein [Flavilitoribacter nigricans]|uniref:Uncharacterized protein n=1 Tax=Flavilitoribacter nigricans (strain ATCC 23147 / DSM 23189 / NBRC 102662 / NCIMB 1420 / SS-2) TaxID=1122177 RepID=A0A2D0MXZ9_FLAN2|nr:hypothetical protein [Flavilitoribacter nigricans]PHN00769.1 hypothetical protein CRP01_40630 [Flavilitoribacter nigricans DSM 23189 = NBRC 102662]
MKRLIVFLYIVSFLLISWSAFSQAVTQTGFVGKFTFQSFSAGGTSDVTGTLDAFSDQTNQYFANNIMAGDVIWDNQGNRWEVMAVNSSNLLQADVDLRNVNSVGGTPVGVGFVSRETANMGLSLFVPDNNIGISQQLKSRIESHNMLLIDQYVASHQDSVFTGATAADTSSVNDPTIGDVLVADDGATAYYNGDNWVVSEAGSSTWLKPELEAGNNVIATVPGFNYLRLGRTYYRTDYGPNGINNLYFTSESTDDFNNYAAGINVSATNFSLERYNANSYINLNSRADSAFSEINLLKGMGDGTYNGRSEITAGNKIGEINFKGYTNLDGTSEFATIAGAAAAVSGSNVAGELKMILADGTTNNSNRLRMSLEGTTGAMRLPAYGTGTTITGTANKYAAFDGTGKLIPVDSPGATWLKPELESGNVDINSNAFALTLFNGSDYNYLYANGIFLEDGDGYSDLKANSLEFTANNGGYLGMYPSGDAYQFQIFKGSGESLDLTPTTIVGNNNIAITASSGLTATTTSGILGITHTGSSGQLIVQSQDERATFQGEEARLIGDTLARMTVGTGEALIKDALVDLTAGSSDFATLDGSINEFRVGTHDIVFEGTDGFYPEWKFQTPVAANDWRFWTGAVGLTIQNGTGGNTVVIANEADQAMNIDPDGDVRLIQYDQLRHDTDPTWGNYAVDANGEFMKVFDGEFNYRDDGINTATNTSTVIMNNGTMELPVATGNAGKMFIVIANSSTDGVTTRTISVASGGTIEGNATLTMDNAFEVYALMSTGTEYVILWNKP